MTAQKIYVNQTALELRMDTNIDLSTMASAVIKYEKPDESTGEWSATAGGSGILIKNFEAGEIDQSGLWKFWVYVPV